MVPKGRPPAGGLVLQKDLRCFAQGDAVFHQKPSLGLFRGHPLADCTLKWQWMQKHSRTVATDWKWKAFTVYRVYNVLVFLRGKALFRFLSSVFRRFHQLLVYKVLFKCNIPDWALNLPWRNTARNHFYISFHKRDTRECFKFNT